MLKPEEIMIPEFSRGFKGYNPQEVDNCINKLISEYRELYFKYAETEEKLGLVAEKYKQTSVRAAEAMKNVKMMAEAIINDAQEQAEKIVSDAKAEAETATSSIKDKCDKILTSYVTAFEDERQKYFKVEEKARLLREELLTAYQAHISEIQTLFPTLDTQEIEEINFSNKVEETE